MDYSVKRDPVEIFGAQIDFSHKNKFNFFFIMLTDKICQKPGMSDALEGIVFAKKLGKVSGLRHKVYTGRSRLQRHLCPRSR